MKIIAFYVFCTFLTGFLSTAQQLPAVYPSPQQIDRGTQVFSLPATYQLQGEVTANPYAVEKLKSLLPGKQGGNFTVYIGKKGDKAVRKYAGMIPDYPEGYYLSVAADRIVLAGNDDRGTYYAVQTLAQWIQGGDLPAVEIRDYPTVRYRGVVEGFYGTPWSHEARLRQLRFYGENKMNTYIYGPKDDPYHSCPDWRQPYPEEQAARIRELTEVAKENAVDFVWAIHPGQDIKWNETDRRLLLDKFEKMYRLGVRSFAVFFDDISGEGTDPVRQAELLNEIDNRFVKVKGDVLPLIMCPTEYNKSWSDPANGYLTILGTKLNPSIRIMWTGDRVISDITEPGLSWINEKIGRPAYIWWNFPVSDYVRDHLLMGPVYGNDTHIGSGMIGFVANPMEKAEASKIAVFSVAGYAWNPEKYKSKEAWEKAMYALLPEDAEALRVFAAHNSDPGPNGHGFRREESVEIQPVADRFLKDYRVGNYAQEDYTALMNEFIRITEAAAILEVNRENPALIEEIRPWIEQFGVMGTAGIEALTMVKAAEAEDQDLFMRKYRHVKALQQKSFQIDQTYNQNPYQPGVKTGSKIMQPLIDSIFVWATQRYNQRNGSALSCRIFTSPHRSYSTVAQFKNLPVRVKTNRVIVSPLLEVVRWGNHEYLGIKLDQIYPLQNIGADFGIKTPEEWLEIEISENGKDWKVVPFTRSGNEVKAVLNHAPAQYIQVFNKGGREQEAYLRKFVITLDK